MSSDPPPLEVLGRAGRRVAYHLLQAFIEGLKAVEAVIEEVGNLTDHDDDHGQSEKIEIE